MRLIKILAEGIQMASGDVDKLTMIHFVRDQLIPKLKAVESIIDVDTDAKKSLVKYIHKNYTATLESYIMDYTIEIDWHEQRMKLASIREIMAKEIFILEKIINVSASKPEELKNFCQN